MPSLDVPPLSKRYLPSPIVLWVMLVAMLGAVAAEMLVIVAAEMLVAVAVPCWQRDGVGRDGARRDCAVRDGGAEGVLNTHFKRSILQSLSVDIRGEIKQAIAPQRVHHHQIQRATSCQVI